MKKTITPALLWLIAGGLAGYWIRAFTEITPLEEKISYRHAINKAMPSVVYIYQDDCTKGPYGCPLGTGVIMDTQGHIVTNHHVIDNKKIFIMQSNGDIQVPAYLARDKMTDLAVLTIDPRSKKLIPMPLAAHSSIGDIAIAIGNPYNLVGSATQGIISATGRNGLGHIGRQSFIQTDASINKGNSGGPLINTRGEMLGLNTLMMDKVIDRQKIEGIGIGFALPTPLVVNIMQKLIRDGEVLRGCIGVEARDATLPEPDGTLSNVSIITHVRKKGPADNVGIEQMDILTAMGQHPIKNTQNALDIIAENRPGTEISISLSRKGVMLKKDVVVEKCLDD